MVPMENIGSDVISEFIRDSLPVYDIRDMAEVMFLFALHTRGVISCTDGLVVPRGSPKYVKGMVATLQPKRAARLLHLSGGVLIGTSVNL